MVLKIQFKEINKGKFLPDLTWILPTAFKCGLRSSVCNDNGGIYNSYNKEKNLAKKQMKSLCERAREQKEKGCSSRVIWALTKEEEDRGLANHTCLGRGRPGRLL